MKVFIDRFEEDFAVVEVGDRMLNVPRELFPGAKEGDMVTITVIGKRRTDGEPSAHDLFERLRRKSRGKNAPSQEPEKEAESTEEEHGKDAEK